MPKEVDLLMDIDPEESQADKNTVSTNMPSLKKKMLTNIVAPLDSIIVSN